MGLCVIDVGHHVKDTKGEVELTAVSRPVAASSGVDGRNYCYKVSSTRQVVSTRLRQL